MPLPHTTLSWIQNGEPLDGTDDPSTSDGVLNRLESQLLENDVYLDGELSSIQGGMSSLDSRVTNLEDQFDTIDGTNLGSGIPVFMGLVSGTKTFKFRTFKSRVGGHPLMVVTPNSIEFLSLAPGDNVSFDNDGNRIRINATPPSGPPPVDMDYVGAASWSSALSYDGWDGSWWTPGNNHNDVVNFPTVSSGSLVLLHITSHVGRTTDWNFLEITMETNNGRELFWRWGAWKNNYGWVTQSLRYVRGWVIMTRSEYARLLAGSSRRVYWAAGGFDYSNPGTAYVEVKVWKIS